MPTVYNIRASNNATFQWTRDLSAFAGGVDMTTATIRMQARVSPFAPDPPAYEWCSTNTANGQIRFDAMPGLAVFVAPVADMARLQGELVYDCRLEFSGGASAVIFGGRMTFAEGITRLASDLTGAGVSGLGDTVTVDGERGTSPGPLPLSLSAAVAACHAMLTPAAFGASYAAWIATLPVYSGSGPLPVPSGQWCSDGGIPIQAP